MYYVLNIVIWQINIKHKIKYPFYNFTKQDWYRHI